MKLEVVVLPVADVDRAKEFYESLGWRLDADFVAATDFRVVQLTPPGSGCSIIFGDGHHVGRARLGAGPAADRARHRGGARRARSGAASTSASRSTTQAASSTTPAPRPGCQGPDPNRRDYGSFASFSDPDGNGWLLQEIKTRLPGR